MSANEIYQWWFIWLAIGAGIVVAAAALLITIVIVAHRIAVLAKTAIAVLLEIEANTKSIWELNTSRKVAGNLLDGATAIEDNAGTILNALSKTEDKQAA
ncbi:MAG: hypothetical protein E2O62_02450 [Gammaproteobacteria bacterium]|nr:hypothetical protein [Pseudomonadota bacterium]MCH8261865.1 hypothetical protein [Pseudomonadota bacterium]MCH8977156.1 hypothetical protein [Pseudomonadota bacterium]TDJ19339.1 MAG: hypothetical protein E2O62_02450 [Gammaproteobacteria bacterium]